MVVVASIVFSWANALYENPHKGPRTSQDTSLIDTVEQVNWSASGCEIAPQSTGGGMYDGGSDFPVYAHLHNENSSSACVVQYASIDPTSFVLVNGTLPLHIPADGYAWITIELLAPDFAPPGPVQITLLTET